MNKDQLMLRLDDQLRLLRSHPHGSIQAQLATRIAIKLYRQLDTMDNLEFAIRI